MLQVSLLTSTLCCGRVHLAYRNIYPSGTFREGKLGMNGSSMPQHGTATAQLCRVVKKDT